jgi:hypothetical protein
MSNEKKILGTPIITVLKEGIAATLGLIIVLGTLILLWPSLTASPVDIDSAQGIFSILGGWGGVVIGYYFGRLPAEKAATKAEEVADAARKEKDTAEKVTANTLADTAKTLSESEEELAELQKKLEKYKKLIDGLIK